MDYAALLALIVTAYKAHRAKVAAGGDDNSDAVIETVMPELMKYFQKLFEKGDSENFFTTLNGLVLALYHNSGDAGQFVIRLIANLKLQRVQSRWPWASLPGLILFKGYFGALEEATKGKDKPTPADIKAATDKVAAEAKKATSDLKSKFNAAKEAVKGMHIPGSNPPHSGGHVPHHDPHAAPSGAAPAAGGTGKKSIEERLSGFFATASLIWERAKWAADRGEDHAQSVAKGLVFATGLIIVTSVTMFLAIGFSDNPRLAVLVIVANSLAWILGPFVGFLVWRRKAREIEARAPSANPHERAGNGFAEGGGIVLVNGFVWGISTIAVAILCAVGAYTHFAWGYVWTGLISIGIAFFAWILGDFAADGAKALIRALVKDENEGVELKLKNRLTRSFSLVGLIYCFAMILPVFNGVMNHTKYSWDVGIPGLFLALLAGFVNTRVSSPASVLPAEHIKARWLGFGQSDYVTARKLFMWAAVPTIALLLLNTFVPPVAKTGGELPSYSERITAFSREDVKPAIVEAVTPTTVESTCSPQVMKFVEGIRKNDCQVILAESSDTNLLSLCNQAVVCGAMNDNGAKKPAVVRKVGPRDAGFNWWYVGVPTAIALFLILAWIGRKDPSTEKKEEKKPAAH